MKKNVSMLVAVLAVLSASAALAEQTPVPVFDKKVDLSKREVVIKDKAVEFSAQKMALDAKDIDIPIVASVEDQAGNAIGTPDAGQLKCLNAQVEQVLQVPKIKKRWNDVVKYLKDMGITGILLTLRVYDTGPSGLNVSATVVDPDKLKVLINWVKDKSLCQVSLPTDINKPFGRAKDREEKASRVGKKTVAQVVDAWKKQKDGLESGAAQ